MYQYRQIIFRLRQGDSIRGIAQAKLADRKKIRQIRDIGTNVDRKQPRRTLLAYIFRLLRARSKIGGVAANLLQDKLLFDFIITMR